MHVIRIARVLATRMSRGQGDRATGKENAHRGRAAVSPLGSGALCKGSPDVLAVAGPAGGANGGGGAGRGEGMVLGGRGIT